MDMTRMVTCPSRPPGLSLSSDLFVVRRHDLIERLAEFVSLISAIGYFFEARREPSVAERSFGPFHEILPTIVILQTLQGDRRNQTGQFVHTGGFDAQVTSLGTKRESLARRKRNIEILVQMADVGNPPNRRTHADDVSAAKQGAPHRDLIEMCALQTAYGAMCAQAIPYRPVRDPGQEQMMERDENR